MIENIKIVYLLGIGGIGMSALARYFNHLGCEVFGYDKTETELTKQLINEGIKINYTDDIECLPNNIKAKIHPEKILIIYTPAIPKNHNQFCYLQNNNFAIYKRAQILGLITKSSKSITVAGTHGKTTTSTLIAHIIKSGKGSVNAFLGGISANYNTNLLLGNENDFTVIEADEYDRSFLHLYPHISVITSMDPDHLDIYGNSDEMIKTYNQFANQVEDSGKLIVKNNLPVSNSKKISYGFESNADFYGTNIRIENGNYYFDIQTKTHTIKNLHSGLPGRHNVENAIAAYASAHFAGLTDEEIKNGLATYSGVKRRFEYIIKTENLIFIDDYAHHPEELKACIASAKEMYPNKKITGIFQPHLFTRTRDFADGFANALDMLDDCILLEIYPARELPIEGINSNLLLQKMKIANKRILNKKDVDTYLEVNKPELLLTLGAGDIDRLVVTIKNKLLN